MSSPNISALEIVCSRVLNAPRETVFAAFENPEALVHWWGPNGFTNRIEAFDFRPGGTWRIIMNSSDAVDFDNRSEFIEVVKPERIVYLHHEPIHRFVMTMLYAELPKGRTRLTWKMVMDRTPENEQIQPFIALATEENFDRLAGFIRSQRA